MLPRQPRSPKDLTSAARMPPVVVKGLRKHLNLTTFSDDTVKHMTESSLFGNYVVSRYQMDIYLSVHQKDIYFLPEKKIKKSQRNELDKSLVSFSADCAARWDRLRLTGLAWTFPSFNLVPVEDQPSVIIKFPFCVQAKHETGCEY